MTKRATVALLAAAAWLPAVTHAADSDYPQKPIRLIIAYAAGGGTEMTRGAGAGGGVVAQPASTGPMSQRDARLTAWMIFMSVLWRLSAARGRFLRRGPVRSP